MLEHPATIDVKQNRSAACFNMPAVDPSKDLWKVSRLTQKARRDWTGHSFTMRHHMMYMGKSTLSLVESQAASYMTQDGSGRCTAEGQSNYVRLQTLFSILKARPLLMMPRTKVQSEGSEMT